MLHALNSKEIAQQQAQSRRLAAQTNSLAMRNNKLNRQLQSLIGQMDRKIESDLQGREMEITAMRERSFLQIGSLTGCLFLLLVVSYIIIHRDIRRIIRYKSKTVSLIKQLYESDMQNKELISSRKKAMHTITHELRTPLTAIHGYAELIQGHDTDNISRYAESILQAAGRMIAMLNTLLDFFRLDSGKENANSAPFRLQGMADALLTEFIPLAEAKDLRFTVECCDDVILMGDKERIMQVCGNLLSNAVKFTEEGGVSLITEYDNGVLTLVVEDTGTGMTEEEQKQAFGAFERLSNAAANIAQEGLPYFSVAFLFFALNLVCVGYYQSLGCFKTAILLMLLRGLVFVVPAFLVLPRVIGVPGLWLSVPLSEIMTQILILVYYLLNRNNKNISNL